MDRAWSSSVASHNCPSLAARSPTEGCPARRSPWQEAPRARWTPALWGCERCASYSRATAWFTASWGSKFTVYPDTVTWATHQHNPWNTEYTPWNAEYMLRIHTLKHRMHTLKHRMHTSNTEYTPWDIEYTLWNTECTPWNTEYTPSNTEYTHWDTEYTPWNTEYTPWNIKDTLKTEHTPSAHQKIQSAHP